MQRRALVVALDDRVERVHHRADDAGDLPDRVRAANAISPAELRAKIFSTAALSASKVGCVSFGSIAGAMCFFQTLLSAGRAEEREARGTSGR